MSSLFHILHLAFDIPLETAALAACKLAAAVVALRVAASQDPKFKDEDHPGIISGRGAARPAMLFALQETAS